MKKLIAILLLICGCAWAQSAIFPSHLTIGPGFAPMQRGGAQTVTPAPLMPTDTDGLSQFFAWQSHATGTWRDNVTGRSATQTADLYQPSVGTDSVVFEGNDFLIFSAPFSSGNISSSTIVARVKFGAIDFFDMIVGSIADFTFCRYSDTNNLLAQMGSGNAVSTADGISVGTWATYAMTHRDNVVCFYKNGVKIGSSVSAAVSSRTVSFYGIGNRWDQPIYGLGAPMKYLAVYNVGKTDSQIASISAEIEGMP